MAFPRASRRGSGSAATDAGYELVAEGGDAVLEVVVVLGVPLGARLARDGISTGEGDVEDVVLVVASVSSHSLAVASGGQGDRSFTNHSLRAVVAVGITPNTVDLGRGKFSYNENVLDDFEFTSLSPQTTAMTLSGLIP